MFGLRHAFDAEMVKACDWAFVNPLRKIFYNLTTASLSIAVALAVGSIGLLQVLIHLLRLKGPLFDYVGGLDFGMLGYLIAGIFLAVWGVSAGLWRFNGGARRRTGRSATRSERSFGVEREKI